MYNNLPPQIWMLAPHDIRKQIIKDFDLKATGPSEVMDNVVVNDGHTAQDLMEISAEKMAGYVGSTESFPRLWELTCAKAKSIITPLTGVIQSKETPHEETTEKSEQSAAANRTGDGAHAKGQKGKGAR